MTSLKITTPSMFVLKVLEAYYSRVKSILYDAVAVIRYWLQDKNQIIRILVCLGRSVLHRMLEINLTLLVVRQKMIKPFCQIYMRTL